MTTDYTPNVNLYKWKTTDTKQTTITETASNAEKIDAKLNDHTAQFASRAIKTSVTDSFYAGTVTPTASEIATYLAKEAITGHAHYGFLDVAQINYAQAGFQAHASFNSSVTISGIQDNDHHHAFQDAGLYENIGTLNWRVGFQSTPRQTAGRVNNLAGVRIDDTVPGAGTVGAQYGVYVSELLKGSFNYAFYSAGNTQSYFNGKVGIGIATSNKKLQVKSAFLNDGLSIVGYGTAKNPTLFLSGSDDDSVGAKIYYENDSGHLRFKPYSGFSTIFDTGRVGISVTSPTAMLHLPAGQSTANTAPLKLNSGTLNTIAEGGAVEFDGTNLYITQNNGTRKTLAFA